MCGESNEFDSSNRIKGALYPYDDKSRDDCEPQWTKLKAAISDNNITNIAITSSYDTGKTSFLKSFFKKEFLEERYKFITVPTFNDKDSNIKEEDIEKNIINQLLFSENPRKFPDSQINRIYTYNRWQVWIIWMLLWIWGMLIFSVTPIWNQFWNKDSFQKIIIILIFCFISWWILYWLVHGFYKLSWNAKANFGPVELSSANTKEDDKKGNQNLFILYGDEIKYYFKKSNVDFLILEDMDRFNNIEIFQKLRELNKNINESQWLKRKNKKVVFIYTLSDTIFQTEEATENIKLINENQAAENKAKFFDYIISLMSFSNLNSSEDIFKKEIEKYDVLKTVPISDNVLLGISFYINDRREIACIIADMDTYLRNLTRIQKDLEPEIRSEPNFMDKLFAAMIYKNVYPRDFDNLTRGTSKLGYFLREINTLRDIVEDTEDIRGYAITEYTVDKSISNLLSVVWDNYDEIINNSKLSGTFYKVLCFIRNTSVLRFLLAEDLIGEDIYEFLSPTQFKRLSFEQIMFIRHAMARRRSGTDFVIDNPKDRYEIINLFEAIKIDYRYVYSSSILKEFIRRGDENRVEQMIEGILEIDNNIVEEKQRKILIESKEKFMDKIISWMYANESEIESEGFISLVWALYESWRKYFIDILKSNKYRANVIRLVLDYIAMDGEIESDYGNNLIGYLIDENAIGKYEEGVEHSELSKEDKNRVLDILSREKEKRNKHVTDQ